MWRLSIVSFYKEIFGQAPAITARASGRVNIIGEHVDYNDGTVFPASTPEIDALVATCIEKGAYGARLTGGGFGGCVVCLVGSGAEDRWVSAVLEAHPDAQRIV